MEYKFIDNLDKVIRSIQWYRDTAAENYGDLTRMEVSGLLIFLQKIEDRLIQLKAIQDRDNELQKQMDDFAASQVSLSEILSSEQQKAFNEYVDKELGFNN